MLRHYRETRSRLLRALDEEPRKVLLIAEEEKKPQNGRDEAGPNCFRVHQEVKCKNVDEHRAKENKTQDRIAVYQHQQSADQLYGSNQIEIVGGKQSSGKLARQPGRRTRIWQERIQDVGAKKHENEAQQDACNQGSNLHRCSSRG